MKKLFTVIVAIIAMLLVSCGKKQPTYIVIKGNDTIVVDGNQTTPVIPVTTTTSAPAETTTPAPAPQPKPEPQGPSQLEEKIAETPQPSGLEHWRGAIGGRYKISMYINNNTGDFWYTYDSHPDGKMWLRVISSEGNYLSLMETDKYGVDTGMFEGRISGNRYSGNFTNFKHNKTYTFSLTRRN